MAYVGGEGGYIGLSWIIKIVVPYLHGRVKAKTLSNSFSLSQISCSRFFLEAGLRIMLRGNHSNAHCVTLYFQS